MALIEVLISERPKRMGINEQFLFCTGCRNENGLLGSNIVVDPK